MQAGMLPDAGTANNAHSWRRIARVVVYLLAELGRNSLWLAGTAPYLADVAPGPNSRGTANDPALHDEAVHQARRQRAARR